MVDKIGLHAGWTGEQQWPLNKNFTSGRGGSGTKCFKFVQLIGPVKLLVR